MDIPLDEVPFGLELKRKKKNVKDNIDAIHVKEAKIFKKVNAIRVQGKWNSDHNIPLPVVNFARLSFLYKDFNQILLQNLAKLSYNLPTPIQAQCIPLMLNRLNVIASAPTGSGKTAAYLLPILQSFSERFVSETEFVVNTKGISSQQQPAECSHIVQLHALILAPTQELARQIWSEAVRLSHGLTEQYFLAFLSRKHYDSRGKIKKQELSGVKNKKIRELRLPRATRILVATPLRMGYLLSLDESACPFDLSQLRWLVIDECDKLLEVDLTDPNSRVYRRSVKRPAHSFRDQINPVFACVQRAQHGATPDIAVRVALFSATIPDQVADWACTELPNLLPAASHVDPGAEAQAVNGLVHVRVGIPNAAVSSVKQELRYCGTEEGKLLEIRFMIVRGLSFPCLIFMESRERAKDIVKEILLSDSDLLVDVISSDKTEAQRAGVMRAFREGRLNVLVCTGLLGRGIDFKGVSMVVNYDMPSSEEDYIHRVGRTGRAGQHGHAVTFWTDADLPHMADILQIMRRSGSSVDPELERLVAGWHSRQSATILGKRKTDASNLPYPVVISKRRGERRLVQHLLSHNRRKLDHSPEPIKNKRAKRIQWLRRWNPHRQRIRDLAGARQTR